MAEWICNAELPGSYLQSRGIVRPGQQFSTPDDESDPFFEPARESWVPVDSAAEKLVKKAQDNADKIGKQRAEQAARRRQLEEDAKNGLTVREFQTKPYDPNAQIGFGRNTRGDARTAGEDEEKRNDAWAKQYAKEQKKADKSDVADQVQDVVREHIALAGGAAAQPVADPLTASLSKDAQKAVEKAADKQADKGKK